MLQQSSEARSVARYLAAVRERIEMDSQLRQAVARAARHLPGDDDPLTKMGRAMPRARLDDPRAASGPASAPYLARDPIVSLVQSVVEERLRERGVGEKPAGIRGWWGWLPRLIGARLHPGRFTPDDPGWVFKVAESMLEHLAVGTHPFNPLPAEYPISATARLVLVGDWGTGLPRAQAVAAHMTQAVAEATEAGREAHVIHLGDVYYSGLASEYRRHALAFWPVTPAQAVAGVTSWALNGNHDMYSGGEGYFQTFLGDARFCRQRSTDGKPTSYFRLTGSAWEFIGLDTAWQPNRLAEGIEGVLQDPQADYVRTVAGATDRKLVLLSHHQYVSAYAPSDIGPQLRGKLGNVLDRGRVRAWWWGHEHICMGFHPHGGVRYPRCIGHGGVPTPQHGPADTPIPSPGDWEERDTFIEDSQRWKRFGYAVLDIEGDQIHARYHNDAGRLIRAEIIA